MRILHLESDPTTGATFVRLVGAGSAEVTAATRVEQAIALLRNQTWDVVVSDCTTPGMGGVELMREVRRIVPTARRVVYTAKPDDERVQLARLSGIVDEVVSTGADGEALRKALGLEPPKAPSRPPMRLTPPPGAGRDIRDFAELLAADLELELYDVLPDGKLSDAVLEKIRYYMARAWDAGFAAAARAQR